MSKGLVGGIATGIIIIGIIVGGVICTKKVPAGYVGIVYNMNGGIEQSYLTSEDKGDSPKDESFSTPIVKIAE